MKTKIESPLLSIPVDEKWLDEDAKPVEDIAWDDRDEELPELDGYCYDDLDNWGLVDFDPAYIDCDWD